MGPLVMGPWGGYLVPGVGEGSENIELKHV